ncbi:hypothetical protein JJV70_08090 [Streptomyces sp. JJ66]|uniref:YiaA/YiaB family inner membrane protein n=1 Tax=Streptomyces sp. JJ66 TaxID=2803843 RepID=UPI001C58B1C4|nr:YiaA/YiaB family inner membrane protein [Streptomyces sp. JJ66]MBW1602072.1 hypothetical protein [Streptomyces sp. JJ66]
MTSPVQRPTTAAFYVQSIIAFALALFAVTVGVVYMPLGPWERGFLALGLLFLVSSTFTLAKCVRDRQESQQVTARVDQARMEKLISEHDPFEVKNF